MLRAAMICLLVAFAATSGCRRIGAASGMRALPGQTYSGPAGWKDRRQGGPRPHRLFGPH